MYLRLTLWEASNDPALDNRPEAFNGIRVNRADNVFMCGVIDDFVLGENLVEMLVANPMIGHEQADFVRDGLANEFGESVSADILDHAGDDIGLTANCARNNGLARARAACAVTAAPVVPVLCFAADESFVYLDNASEFFKVPVSERRPDAVTHVPRGFVRAEAHEPTDLKCAHSLLTGQHQMNDTKPISQRFICVLKNCAGNMREAIGRLRSALVALPVPRIVFQLRDVFSTTAWAANAFGPSFTDKVDATGFFVREMPLKFGGGQLMNGLASSHWSQSF